MRVRAHAKINLSLRVLGTRADGYHELRTIFQSIALHDTLTIRRVRGPFRVACDDLGCPVDESNLVWKAAARLWKASGRRGAPRGIVVDLVKRIPMQAGLGGGSSDAAATLIALGRLWRVKPDRIRDAGAAVGADVPFFFEGGTALGLDRGDLLFSLLDRPRAWVVLVLPDFGVSTKDAFGWWDEAALPRVTRETANDLQAPVAAHHPVIARIVTALEREGAAQASMSGSGSAVFGLFSSRTAADRAARRVGSTAGCRVLVTRTLTRAEYQRALAPI
jgi:4-diphosphocytidyl-2-C-methyl-D-erythritol kinase